MQATSTSRSWASFAAIGSNGEERPGDHSVGMSVRKFSHCMCSMGTASGFVRGSAV